MYKDSGPTAYDDPEGYLSLYKFSRRIVCPRTKMPVSYADFGDPDGTPLLWMMPSGGSRWFAAAHGTYDSPAYNCCHSHLADKYLRSAL
jgi:hypothetical protein